MRGLSRSKERLVVILLARGAILSNSNFYCDVFVLRQEEKEVEKGLKRKFYDATPMLGLQEEDDQLSSCAAQQVRHRRAPPPVLVWTVPYPVQRDLFTLPSLLPVSFLPGEIYGTAYAYVWCSLSPFRY